MLRGPEKNIQCRKRKKTVMSIERAADTYDEPRQTLAFPPRIIRPSKSAALCGRLLQRLGGRQRRPEIEANQQSFFDAHNGCPPNSIHHQPLKRGAIARSRDYQTTTTTLLRYFDIFTSSAGSYQFAAAGSAFVIQFRATSPSIILPSRLSQLPLASRHFTTSSPRLRSRMPPKKKEEEKKILLGRPGNSLKSGIVRWCNPSTPQKR